MDGDKVENGKVEDLSQGKVAHKLLFCNQSGPRFALSGLAVEEKWLWPALLLPESLLMFCIWQMWKKLLVILFFTQTWKLTKGEWNSIAFKCFLLPGALISNEKDIMLPIILLPLIFLLEISIFNLIICYHESNLDNLVIAPLTLWLARMTLFGNNSICILRIFSRDRNLSTGNADRLLTWGPEVISWLRGSGFWKRRCAAKFHFSSQKEKLRLKAFIGMPLLLLSMHFVLKQ